MPFGTPLGPTPNQPAPAWPPPAAGATAWAPPPAGSTVAPAAGSVDAFADGLAPFLGDPTRSHASGRVVQVVTGLLALYSLVRAGAWAYFASLTATPTAWASIPDTERVLDVGNLLDVIDALVIPTFVAVIVTDLVWRRARRPKETLQAYGEAYVEATIRRAVPVALRAVTGALVFAGFVVNVFNASPRDLLPSQVSGYAMVRSFSALAFAFGWASFALWVSASERHLARRIEATAGPVQAGFAVPYLVPEKESGFDSSSAGQSAGLGWLLRTAGLILALIFSLPVFVASLFGLASEPLVALVYLAVSAPILALVVWAFVRRWKASHPRTATG